MREAHTERLARSCIADAKAILGSGWGHVSDEIRWGLVCASIVALHEAQDESISSDSVRRLISKVTELCGYEIFGGK
jgi:hypothetical protein